MITSSTQMALVLGLDLDSHLSKPIRRSRRSLYAVLKALDTSNCAVRVVEALRDIVDSTSFKYLRAYVNTTKHLSLVDRSFAVGVADDNHDRYGLMIQAFRYEVDSGRVEDWPCKWMDEFLCESLEFVSRSVDKLGRALEEVLASRAP